ncbi:YniB family protein [Moellerella wisconsensis]|uniref:YniB family protein n=1 Tax=Moellerella wisconsensis TaxID=158849 RepID=A0A9Q8V5S5_9GAMM|nr:YniB family protein [Moellerella wisconsensis]UNH31971.1 YniB family protein [Moellerella wisconsensis]UNH43661.1 YniB family protein [Moellerella wisconsensis]
MNFKTMSSIAIGKRIVGWIIFIFSLISTLISLISLAGIKGIQGEGINAVLNDFIKVMAEMARQSSPFLNFFWENSPVPSTEMGFSSANISFIIIFLLIFVGLALSASGLRMFRQIKFIRESLEDHVIVEKAKGNDISQTELEQKVTIPRHSIFSEIFVLYFWPIIFGLILYFGFKLLNW